jgi:hypothetical protein
LLRYSRLIVSRTVRFRSIASFERTNRRHGFRSKQLGGAERLHHRDKRETGATRIVTTDESGVYRFPLLPLGLTASPPQFQDNLTRTNGAHVVKFGGGLSLYSQAIRSDISSTYTFPSIAAYIAARNGTNPRSYTAYSETFGELEFNYKATFWNFFAQDDWKLTRRLKTTTACATTFIKFPKPIRHRFFRLRKNSMLTKTISRRVWALSMP